MDDRRLHQALMLASIALVTAACAGGPPKQAGAEDDFGAKPADTSASSAGAAADTGAATPPPSEPLPSSPGGLNQAQEEQIKVALRRGVSKAEQCPAVVPNSPSGEGEIKVTFDGKKGRSVDASVGAPFAGTPVEACLKRAFVDEIIVPFDGPPLERTATVKLAAKPAADDKSKKPKK